MLLELNPDLDLEGWVKIAGQAPVSPFKLIPILQQMFGLNEALQTLMKLVFEKYPEQLKELSTSGIELNVKNSFYKLLKLKKLKEFSAAGI